MHYLIKKNILKDIFRLIFTSKNVFLKNQIFLILFLITKIAINIVYLFNNKQFIFSAFILGFQISKPSY